MRTVLAVMSGIVLWAIAAPALAQALPNHINPNAREEIPDLSGVPAIRFLTSADFPPFNYRDRNGELVGFHIDLARAICDELDITCTIQAWPWEQVADALAENQGDALIAGLAMTPAAADRFDFSSIYLMLPARFVALGDAAASFSQNDLDNRTVSVRAGSAHEKFLETYVPGAALKPYDSEVAALDAMAAGEVELFFGDAMRAAFWLNTHLECCAFAGEAYFRSDWFGGGFAVAVPAGRDPVRKAIDHALVRLKRSGTFDELYLRWFPVSFY